MDERPAAAILSVGTELTEGSIQDTHGKYIAEALHRLGMRTESILLIPDKEDRFRTELLRLTRDTRLVLITGGLGPTSDDLTREVVAAAAERKLEFHDELWEEIERRFAGRRLSATNRRQAEIPEGFTPIRNPYGTAPGFFGYIRGESGSTLVVALPGPPRELHPLLNDEVLPIIRREFALAPAAELRITVFLLSESLLEELLKEVRKGEVSWGTRAEAYRIVVILRGGEEGDRRAMFEALRRKVGELRVRLGEVGAASIAETALEESESYLVAAESCTGGLIGTLLTDLSGASGSFWGSLVVYSNEAKMRVLGVDSATLERFGAVSRETVREMAGGALRVSNAEISVSVSGIAGPTGGTPEKPVGTVWIATATETGLNRELEFHFGGDRGMVRRRSAVAALLMVEGTIRGKEVDNIELWQYI